MKNNCIKLIFVIVLIFSTSTALFAQQFLKDTLWNNSNQGKDPVSNRQFESLLAENVYKKEFSNSTYAYYSMGYLKNIDFYYVSYSITDEASIDFITEFFRLDAKTDISSFDYTKSSWTLYDSNPNHFNILDWGNIEAFEDYLIFYNERHVSVFKKMGNRNAYEEISQLGFSGHCKEVFSYDGAKKQIVRRVDQLNGTDTTIYETYQITKGKIVKIDHEAAHF